MTLIGKYVTGSGSFRHHVMFVTGLTPINWRSPINLYNAKIVYCGITKSDKCHRTCDYCFHSSNQRLLTHVPSTMLSVVSNIELLAYAT